MPAMIQLGIEESTAVRPQDASPKRASEFLRCLYDRAQGSETASVYIENIVDELQLEEPEAETILQSLTDKDLIKLRLQCIVSITQAGIDEVKATLEATAPIPALPIPLSIEDQTAAIENLGAHLLGVLHAKPDSPPPNPPALPSRFVDKDSDDLAEIELLNICQAIGLDPEDFKREVAAAESAATHERNVPLPEPAGAARAEMSFFQANDLPDILASLKLRLLKVRLPPDDIAEAEAEIATAIAQLLSPRPKLQIIAASLNTLLSILEKAGTSALTSDIEMSLVRIRFFLTQLPV
jgi:hypothetical protein